MTKKSRNWSKLFNFIDYFASCPKTEWAGGEKNAAGHMIMPYPNYDREVGDFIKELRTLGILECNYLGILRDNGILTIKDFPERIESADETLLCAMLTGYVRQERFGDGLIASGIEDGTIAKILRQLQALHESPR
ncbi:MAG: DUF6508 domain-containing protein [Planctomycetes bacterium]|nr:DUF6508 domain-containing protein [Planctomycetota bacterium]